MKLCAKRHALAVVYCAKYHQYITVVCDRCEPLYTLAVLGRIPLVLLYSLTFLTLSRM